MGTDQVYWIPGPLSRVFTLWYISVADQMSFGFGISCYRLDLAASGSRVYCKEVNRTTDPWPTRSFAPMLPTLRSGIGSFRGVWLLSRHKHTAATLRPARQANGSTDTTQNESYRGPLKVPILCYSSLSSTTTRSDARSYHTRWNDCRVC